MRLALRSAQARRKIKALTAEAELAEAELRAAGTLAGNWFAQPESQLATS